MPLGGLPAMIGRTVGHYRILKKIGHGGMGEVFLAEDTSLRRKVALKFLPPEMQQADSNRQRFLREARSAAALWPQGTDDSNPFRHLELAVLGALKAGLIFGFWRLFLRLRV